MKPFNRGVDIHVSKEDALKVNNATIIDKDGKIYGDIHAAAGSIGTAELADDGVTTAKIAAGAITVTELASNAVETAKIKNDAVTADKLADDAVVTANIVAKNVTGAKIADKGVDTAQIADSAIKALQINTDAVETTKIKDANVTADKLAANAVETAKILDANVTLAKLAAGIKPSHIVKFFVLGSTITGTELVGLAVGDLVVTITGAGAASVATCADVDTLPADPADDSYLIVFRAVA
jgi:hypothetical protein